MKLSLLCVSLSNSFYSSTDQYLRCMEVLFQHPPHCEYEVLLVDNGSTDNSVQRFREAWGNRVTVIPLAKNYGFQIGMNRAAKDATGEYICLINPDIEVSPDMFDKLIEYLETHPDVALVAPQLLNPDGSVQDSYRRFMKPVDFIIKRLKPLHRIPYFRNRMRSYLMWSMDKTKVQEVDWVLGAFAMMPRKYFDEVGGFDERFFLFNGDTDICRKFWKHGWKVIYNPKVQALHGDKRVSGNGFWGALFKKTAWFHLRDMITYFLKWGL